MDAVNHQFKLAARPVGLPKPGDWEYAEAPVPELGEGEVLVKVLYLSLDPAMRGWMNDTRSYIPPVAIGEVMRSLGAGSDFKKLTRATHSARSMSSPGGLYLGYSG